MKTRGVTFALLAMLILLAADDPLAAQDRDFSAERLILDDNGVDGGVNRVVLQTSSTLATDVIYTFPASGTVGQVLATDGSGILSWVPSGNALLDEPFLTTSTSSTLTSERILTGGLGVTLTDGGANMPMSVAIGQDVAPTASPTFDGMRLTDDLDMDDNTIFDIPEIVAPPNTTIDIRSERSVVLHIDENNTGGGPSDFEPGLLLGRESDTGNVVPLDSANAAVGEAIPIGILAEKVTQLAADGTQANVAVCVAGLVSEDKLILQSGGDSLDTVISLKRLRDRILGDTMGIKLVAADDLTGFDNQ